MSATRLPVTKRAMGLRRIPLGCWRGRIQVSVEQKKQSRGDQVKGWLMRHVFAILVLVGVAAPAHAEDCSELGLTNGYLTEHFCAQLRELAGSGTTRGMQPDNNDTLADRFHDLEIIQDAYRADPRKTLELIERIRNAGGLATQ